jgi:hypothetical protein
MIGRSLAKARNEAIFLNLVRASHDYPLAFTAISQVTPSMTNTSTLALPSFLVGPQFKGALPTSSAERDVVFGNTTATESTAISSNFNVATQETSEFYLGFLKPIDLQTLDYFIRQGYSRELLFWLFADSVEMKIGPRLLGMRYSPPSDYGCDPHDPRQLCFPDFMVFATAAGLTVEEQTLQSASSAGKAGGGGASKDSSGAGGAKTETTIFARFCFDPVLAEQAQNEMGEEWQIMRRAFNVSLATPKCGTHWNPVGEAQTPQADTLNFNVGPYVFKITPRSAYGVFEFLGTLLKMQRDHPERLPTAYVPPSHPDVTGLPMLYTVPDDHSIFTVVQGYSPDCFSHTWFIDGDYCVPESATNTKRIFGLLAQLIAIETAASDLSITPIVRVIQ